MPMPSSVFAPARDAAFAMLLLALLFLPPRESAGESILPSALSVTGHNKAFGGVTWSSAITVCM